MLRQAQQPASSATDKLSNRLSDCKLGNRRFSDRNVWSPSLSKRH